MKTAVAQSVSLANDHCVHGMSDMNWCALCKQANGDKHSNTILKAFNPKTNRKQHVSTLKPKIEFKTRH
jgi:hypothetical protein